VFRCAGLTAFLFVLDEFLSVLNFIESLFHDLLGLGTDWRVKELAHLPGAHSEVHIVIEATAGLCEPL
jgi:hypothetical protein